MTLPPAFSHTTPAGHLVSLDWKTYDSHIKSLKYGSAVTSVFEIQEAILDPVEVRQSDKDAASYLYVRAVGQIGGNDWFTVVFVKLVPDVQTTGPDICRVTTAYNALSYAQKGGIVWP